MKNTLAKLIIFFESTNIFHEKIDNFSGYINFLG